eukprot:22244_1
MGNQHSNNGDQCIFLPPFVKSKYSKKNKKKLTDDRVDEQLIIELHRRQVQTGTMSMDLTNQWMTSDQRRLVFVSCLGLYHTWESCPAAILYSAIFVLPLKRQWIYDPMRYQDEIHDSILGQIHSHDDAIAFDHFLRLLRWKDHQKLAFWMLDETHPITKDESTPTDASDSRFANDLVHPFWVHLSDSLTQLYDPITKSHYKPLKFNPKWWKFTYDSLVPSQYNARRHKVLAELYFVTGRFKSIQEMIYQSNPGSLNPIMSYNPLKPSKPQAEKNSFVCIKNTVDHYGFVAFRDGCCPDLDNEKDVNEGVWMISTEYDENDLSGCDISVPMN